MAATRAGSTVMDPARADELLATAETQGADLPGPDELLSRVTKAAWNERWGEEGIAHLRYDKLDPAALGDPCPNSPERCASQWK